jgi:hypothetical protein
MKRKNISLTLQQIRALEHWSAETGLKFGELLRRIVDKALDEHLAQQQASASNRAP